MWSRAISGVGQLLGLGRQPDPDQERRLWGRIRCDIETTIEPANWSASAPLPARVRNVSRGGINVTAGRPFEPGALLSVSLPVEGQTQILACVVRCEGLGEGRWELGCTFAAPLSDEDLKCLGASRERPVPAELRSAVRFPCQARATYRVVRTGGGGAAEVLNISASGIALRAEDVLAVGELLHLDLSRDGPAVLTTLASVVRTGTAPEGWRVTGCNFICELSEAQVAALR